MYELSLLILGIVLGGEIVYLWNYSDIKRGRSGHQ